MAHHRQLVLLACIDSHESPAIRVKPDFSEVSVVGLGTGDQVWMCSADLQIELTAGLTPFPNDLVHKQVTFRKASGTAPLPTTIEILRGSC